MVDSIQTLLFPAVSGKEVVARFDGGDITSNGGLLLLAQADKKIGLLRSMAEAIKDKRQTSKVGHDLHTLLEERVYAIACGYEDANDLDDLRSDPALKLACGRAPQKDADLASQPTISRLENGVSRCDLLLFVTDELGCQRLLTVLLRPGKPGTKGVGGLVKRAVRLLRARFPQIEIVLRADGGFGNDTVLRLCDTLKIHYVLGLPGNRRLHTLSTSIQMDACCKYTFEGETWQETGVCREFGKVEYKAGKSRKGN